MRPPSGGARSSSSSSLMSPGGGRDPAPLSLSASLSRRLRSNGSLKGGGGQSPATFSGAAARKKGGAFEAAEPSSPKVTCIGQVRVRTKGVAGVGSRSASFRRSTRRPAIRNQRWVHHLSLSICDALRYIGSDFNCFAPCSGAGERSCCSSSRAGEDDDEAPPSACSSSCSAVFSKWLRGEVVGLVVQEVPEKRRCDMDLLAGAGELPEEDAVLSSQPAIDEAAAAASPEKVCEPPRNALLLMRCRSDPARMAALGNRLWGLPVAPAKVPAAGAQKEDEYDRDEVAEAEEPVGDQGISSEDANVVVAVEDKRDSLEDETAGKEVEQPQVLTGDERDEQISKESAEATEGMEKSEGDIVLLPENMAAAAPEEEGGMKGKRSRSLTERRSKAKDMEMRRSRSAKDKERRRNSFSSERESSTRRQSFSSEKGARRASFSVDCNGVGSRRGSFSVEGKDAKPAAAKIKTLPKSESKIVVAEESKVQEGGAASTELPDCLLLMMYEPKLSMEVSKETWVCSTDFLHWRPPPPRYISNAASVAVAGEGEGIGGDVDAVKETTLLPPAPPQGMMKMMMMEEEQVVPAAAAPFVLTRCKSEPTRSSERLAPETWFWKDRHQPIAGGAAAGMSGEFVV